MDTSSEAASHSSQLTLPIFDFEALVPQNAHTHLLSKYCREISARLVEGSLDSSARLCEGSIPPLPVFIVQSKRDAALLVCLGGLCGPLLGREEERFADGPNSKSGLLISCQIFRGSGELGGDSFFGSPRPPQPCI